MIPALLGLAAVVAAFVAWRWTSVGRGAKQRDATLLAELDPLAGRLERAEGVNQQDISELARRPELRQMLYQLLHHYNRTDLFPAAYLSPESQGEAVLAYWLMHPNELQDAPAAIQLVDKVEREREGNGAHYYVYRYRMGAGHWAEKDGWLLGVAGPFAEDEAPYSGSASAFSRCGDKEGTIESEELVDWYIKMSSR